MYKGKVCIRAKWPVRLELILVSLALSDREYFYSPTGWYARVTPSIEFAGTHLYTWVERGTVRVKCLDQEHNTMSLARARTGPLDLETSALTMRPPRLPQTNIIFCIESL